MPTQHIASIDPKIGYYIAGFTDGEGSFNVSLMPRNDYRGSWKVRASFNISQKDRVILARIKHVLSCGTLRERKDGVVYYEVTNLRSLQEIVIPFFERFQFLSANKKRNFAIFKQIIEAMGVGDHLSKEGLRRIMVLRERLNEGRGRKRKYSLLEVCQEGSSETTRKRWLSSVHKPIDDNY